MRRLLPCLVAGLVAAACTGIPPTDPDGRRWGTEREPVARVVLVGDSLVDNVEDEAAAALAAVGIEVFTDGRNGAGLLNGPVDWPVRLDSILDSFPADAVVIELAGNFWDPYRPGEYWPPYRSAPQAALPPDTPEFYAAWRAAAQALVDGLETRGVAVLWVLSPPMGPPFTTRTAAINDGYRTLSGATVLDSGRVLAGDDGEWVAGRAACGPSELRLGDRLHLTDAGAFVFGNQIAHDVAQALGVDGTAVPCLADGETDVTLAG